MEILGWGLKTWVDILQSIGIVGGLVLSVVTTRRDDRTREISNMLVIAEHHRKIWKELYDRPALGRVLDPTADLKQQRVTKQEELFVTSLILHLGNVHRAAKAGMFVKLEGLREDIRRFFALPIPAAVWNTAKPLQDANFVQFVERTRDGSYLMKRSFWRRSG